MRTRHTFLALGLPLGSLLMAMTVRAEPLPALELLSVAAVPSEVSSPIFKQQAVFVRKKQVELKQRSRLSRAAEHHHKVKRRTAALVKPAALFPHCVSETVKWQRNCDEMGYPANFQGLVIGQSQYDCQAGERRDIWLHNSCAAPVIASVHMAAVVEAENTPAVERAQDIQFALPAKLRPITFRAVRATSVQTKLAEKSDSIEVSPSVSVTKIPAAPQPSMVVSVPASKPPVPIAKSFGTAALPMKAAAANVLVPARVDDAPLPTAAPRMPVDMAALPQDLPPVVPEEKPAVVAAAALPVTKDHILKQSSRCGSAAGRALVAAPQAELCIDGLATQIIGAGPWQWSCEGADGSQTACFAMVDTVQLAANKAMPDAALKIAENKARLEASAPEVVASDARSEMAAAPALHAPAIENTASAIPEEGVDTTTILTTPQLPGVTLLATATETEPLATAALATPRLSLAAAQTDDVVPVADTDGGAILDADLTALPFAPGEEALSDEMATRLETVGQRLAVNRLAHVTVTAYAGIDDQTDARMARRRSLTRALAVRDALLLGGASSDQIRVRARGANVVSGEPDRVDLSDR